MFIHFFTFLFISFISFLCFAFLFFSFGFCFWCFCFCFLFLSLFLFLFVCFGLDCTNTTGDIDETSPSPLVTFVACPFSKGCKKTGGIKSAFSFSIWTNSKSKFDAATKFLFDGIALLLEEATCELPIPSVLSTESNALPD